MNCDLTKKALKEAKTFGSVEKMLKEAKLSPSAMRLVQTAYQIQEKQPQLAADFIDTVIQELESKKLQEYEGGSSEQASNRADPLPEVQKNTDDGEKPNTGIASPENQMKEDVMGMLHPDIAQHMMNPNPPPMNFPQQIKQMQYTIKKTIEPLIKEIQSLKASEQQLKEGLVALDNKFKETVQVRTVELDVNPRGGSAIKETISLPLYGGTPHKSLEDRRNEILVLNNMMNTGEIKSADIYQ